MQIISASRRRTQFADPGVTRWSAKHHVRLLYRLQAAQRQQPGIARPGADENNFTQLLFRLMRSFFQRLSAAALFPAIIRLAKRAIEDPLPEVPPRCRRRQMF